MNRTRGYVLVVALQAALLLGWAGFHEWNRASAQTILLETVPVDPRDLLRGDYMILSYKISRVPAPPKTGRVVTPGREIWVTLRPQGRFHEVAAASWVEPAAADLLVVRGRVRDGAAGGTIRVDYDIEKYFVPEGKGQPRFKEMVVEATVSEARRLGVKRLLIDGQAYP